MNKVSKNDPRLTPEERHEVAKKFAIEVWGYLPEYAEGVAQGGMTNALMLGDRLIKAQLAKVDKLTVPPEVLEATIQERIRQDREDRDKLKKDSPELRKKAETIAIKTYEMAMNCKSRGDYDEFVVRKATLEWARAEIIALIDEEGIRKQEKI